MLSEIAYSRYSVSDQGITPTKRGIEAASERNLETLREKASKEIKNSQQYNERYYDKKRKPPLKYKVGDLVALKNFDSTPGVAHKLTPRFKGSYEIIKELRNNRYVVADIKGFQLSQQSYQGI